MQKHPLPSMEYLAPKVFGQTYILMIHMYLRVYATMYVQRNFLYFLDRFIDLRSTTTGAPLAARDIRILPKNQHA